jgi:hypothetical protein
MSGATAGGIAGAITNPFDLIKACIIAIKQRTLYRERSSIESVLERFSIILDSCQQQ